MCTWIYIKKILKCLVEKKVPYLELWLRGDNCKKYVSQCLALVYHQSSPEDIQVKV